MVLANHNNQLPARASRKAEWGTICQDHAPALPRHISSGGEPLARINLDDELRADPRFHLLCALVNRNLAYGALACLWELGQSYWKKAESLIPRTLAEHTPNYAELVQTGFAQERGEEVYCSGAKERWGFLLARSEAGKRSAEARKAKFGTAIPFGASNRTNAEQPPNKTEPSSSSSSSSQNKNKARKPSAPLGFLFWEKYPRRNGKKIGQEETWSEWQKLSPEEQTKATEALEKQKAHYAHCKANGLFVAEFPDPSRWLKKKRFNDELGESAHSFPVGPRKEIHAHN